MKKRMYALFWNIREEGKRKRYERACREDGTPYSAFPKDIAVRVYQDLLISTAFTGRPLELRPVYRHPSASLRAC